MSQPRTVSRRGEDPADGGRRFRAHHGSISLPERRATEEALKAGEVPAVVATASLELGIDMGAVDLVCQVESPGSVARGLQRVGRAGHVVRGVSKGRIDRQDAGRSAGIRRACAARCSRARSSSFAVPHNCLDVLAQQVIACVAMEPVGRSGALRPGPLGVSVSRSSRPSRSRASCG